MAKNKNSKLKRLHGLTVMFNDVATVVIELLDNNIKVSENHISVVSAAVESEGGLQREARAVARDLLYSLTDNKELYRQKYVRG